MSNDYLSISENDVSFLLISLVKNKGRSLALLNNLKNSPNRKNFKAFIDYFANCLNNSNIMDYPDREVYREKSFIEAKTAASDQLLSMLSKNDDEIDYIFKSTFMVFIEKLQKYDVGRENFKLHNTRRMPEDAKREGVFQHPDRKAAYEYTRSVADTADIKHPNFWKEWALYEAFLAGITYAENNTDETN